MKISIDTKEDSAEDIKRLINMLQNFVNHKQSSSNSEFVDIFSSNNNINNNNTNTNQSGTADQSFGLFSMFGTSPEPSIPTIKTEETPKPTARVKIIEY